MEVVRTLGGIKPKPNRHTLLLFSEKSQEQIRKYSPPNFNFGVMLDNLK